MNLNFMKQSLILMALVTTSIAPSYAMEEGASEEVNPVGKLVRVLKAYQEDFNNLEPELTNFVRGKAINKKDVVFDQYEVMPYIRTALTVGLPVFEGLASIDPLAPLTFPQISMRKSDRRDFYSVVNDCAQSTMVSNINAYTERLSLGNGMAIAQSYSDIEHKDAAKIHNEEIDSFLEKLKEKRFEREVVLYKSAIKKMAATKYGTQEYKLADNQMLSNWAILEDAASELQISKPRSIEEIADDLYSKVPLFNVFRGLKKNGKKIDKVLKSF